MSRPQISRRFADVARAMAAKPKRYGSGGPYEDRWGYSRVVRTAGMAWTAGTTSVVNGELQGLDSAETQAGVALQQAVEALWRAGFSRDLIVQSRMYVVDIENNAEAVGRAHGAVLGDVRPAATMVGVTGLADPRMLVEVELMAAKPGGGVG
ncbi:RidA family protein [Acidothermaceae bacterium B102]|nr:RidA family protein [Acidothermaceae bacterium B102]